MTNEMAIQSICGQIRLSENFVDKRRQRRISCVVIFHSTGTIFFVIIKSIQLWSMHLLCYVDLYIQVCIPVCLCQALGMCLVYTRIQWEWVQIVKLFEELN